MMAKLTGPRGERILVEPSGDEGYWEILVKDRDKGIPTNYIYLHESIAPQVAAVLWPERDAGVQELVKASQEACALLQVMERIAQGGHNPTLRRLEAALTPFREGEPG